MAIALCKETNLYGFWPFDTDLDGNELPYHYYDSLKLAGTTVAHDFPIEFKFLLQLHENGLINLNINTCDT